MSADLLVLRDYVERGLMAFDIPYTYLSGEVMEAQIPATYQPLFGGCKALKLGFDDTVDPDDESIQTVTHGAQVLDALGRLLEGDRNTIGHAMIARKIGHGDGAPDLSERLTILNARVDRAEPTVVYKPVIRIEFRLRSFTGSGLRSQSVPIFFDADKGRVVDGTRYANLRLQDVEETIGNGDGRSLKTPQATTLAKAAAAGADHLRRALPPLAPIAEGEPARVHLRPVRLLVLHDPRPGVRVTVAERSTKREFEFSFPVSDDLKRVNSPCCSHCGRIKTHFYVSHRTGGLICTDCSLLCVGCWDAYALDGQNCSVCTKRRYCPGCMEECGECGTTVCPDHRRKDAPADQPCCQDCTPAVVSGDSAADDMESSMSAPAESELAGAGAPAGLDEDIFGGQTESESPAVEADPPASSEPDSPEPADDVDFFLNDDAPSENEDEPGDDLFSLESVGSAQAAAEDAADDDVFGAENSDFWGDDSGETAADGPIVEDAPEQPRRPAPRTVRQQPEPAREDEPEPDPYVAPEEVDEEFGLEPDSMEPEEEEEPEPIEIRPSRRAEPGTINCACHGEPQPVNALRMDFLSGRYYCPDHVEPCGNCGQATSLDFLEGDPPLCFYCANRMPLNLDPEAEEIFKREVQHVLPIKYRLGNCRVSRSPHHLAFYLKPMLGKEIILYWDRWTDALLDDNQFN